MIQPPGVSGFTPPGNRADKEPAMAKITRATKSTTTYTKSGPQKGMKSGRTVTKPKTKKSMGTRR